MLTDLAAPYLLYIKLGLAAFCMIAVVSVGFYIRHVFNERAELMTLAAKQANDLVTAQVKYDVIVKQAELLQEANKKIMEAIRNVKVTSNLYVDKIEAARVTPPAAGGSVLIPAGVPKTSLPAANSIFVPVSSARAAAEPA